MIPLNPHARLPTEREYELMCRIVKKTIQYEDDQSRGSLGNTEAQVAILVPEGSSECDRFLAAWLPEPKIVLSEGRILGDDFYECVAMVGSPIHSPVRLALHRASKLHPEPYLFVMSEGVGQDLLKIPTRLFRKPRIQVKILGEDADTVADSTHDPAMPFTAKYKNVK